MPTTDASKAERALPGGSLPQVNDMSQWQHALAQRPAARGRRSAVRAAVRMAPWLSAAALLWLPGAEVAAKPPPDPCAGLGTVLLVETARHELRQCEAGATRRTWPVALGSGGLDKRREGDARTPLGRYPLGVPRGSASFGTFIPVGYPTPEQARKGYTGSAIGIHGPARAWRHLGAANVATDWTLGCIALASDPAIESVAAWVRGQSVRQVVLR